MALVHRTQARQHAAAGHHGVQDHGLHETELRRQLVNRDLIHLQGRELRIDEFVGLVVEKTAHPPQELEARIANGVRRRVARVHRHVTAIPSAHRVPDPRPRRGLLGGPRILVAADHHFRQGVVCHVVYLSHLQVAVQREPIAGVVARRCAAVDAAVVHLDDVATRVEHHLPRIRMGCAAIRRATARDVRDGARMCQVFPLRRRHSVSGRDSGVASEQAAGEVRGADEVPALALVIGAAEVLAVAAHIDDVRVGGVGADGEVDGTLATRFEARIEAHRLAIQLGRQGQVHGRPGAALVVCEADVVGLPRHQHCQVKPPVRRHGHLGVVVSPFTFRIPDDLRERGLDRPVVAAHVAPRRSAVVAAVNPLFPHRHIEAVAIGGIHHQVEGAGIRQARARRPLGATVQAPIDAVLPRPHRDDETLAINHDAGDVLMENVSIGRIDVPPSVAAVLGEEEAPAVTAKGAKAAVAADAGQDGVRIIGVHGHGANGQRWEVVRERTPTGPSRGGVVGAPDAAVHRADEEHIHVRRMCQHRVYGTCHLAIWHHVLDLSVTYRRWADRHPAPAACRRQARSMLLWRSAGRRGRWRAAAAGHPFGRRGRWQAHGIRWQPHTPLGVRVFRREQRAIHLRDDMPTRRRRTHDKRAVRRQHGAPHSAAPHDQRPTPGLPDQLATQHVPRQRRRTAFDEGLEPGVVEEIERQRRRGAGTVRLAGRRRGEGGQSRHVQPNPPAALGGQALAGAGCRGGRRRRRGK